MVIEKPKVDIALESGRDLEKVAEEFFRWARPLSRKMVLGIDIGRVQDHTAVSLVESYEVLTDFDNHGAAYRKERRMAVRYLERMPRGMSWPDMVKRLREIHQSMAGDLQARTWVVDATGVGDSVVNLIRKADLAKSLAAIQITSGHEVSPTHHSYGYYVPKRDLITNLQLLMQGQRLKVAAELQDAQLLMQEMKAMEVQVSLGGGEQSASWREKEHDDLVLATALACWMIETGRT
jgi:hypothetical protein